MKNLLIYSIILLLIITLAAPASAKLDEIITGDKEINFWYYIPGVKEADIKSSDFTIEPLGMWFNKYSSIKDFPSITDYADYAIDNYIADTKFYFENQVPSCGFLRLQMYPSIKQGNPIIIAEGKEFDYQNYDYSIFNDYFEYMDKHNWKIEQEDLPEVEEICQDILNEYLSRGLTGEIWLDLSKFDHISIRSGQAFAENCHNGLILHTSYIISNKQLDVVEMESGYSGINIKLVEPEKDWEDMTAKDFVDQYFIGFDINSKIKKIKIKNI